MFIVCFPWPPPTVSVTVRREPVVQHEPDCQLTSNAKLACGASATLDGFTETQVIRNFPRHVKRAVPDCELVFVTMNSVEVAGLAIDVVKTAFTERFGTAASWLLGSVVQPRKLMATKVIAAPKRPRILMIVRPFYDRALARTVENRWLWRGASGYSGQRHQISGCSA